MLFTLAEGAEKTRYNPTNRNDKLNHSNQIEERSIDYSVTRKSRLANFSHISDLPRNSNKNRSKSQSSGTIYTTPKQLQERDGAAR